MVIPVPAPAVLVLVRALTEFVDAIAVHDIPSRSELRAAAVFTNEL